MAALIVSAIYVPVAHGQANLTFYGGGGSPLSIALRQPVSYAITDSDCSSSGPIFVFDEAGNPFSGTGPLVSGSIAYSINNGTSQSITNANSGVAVNDVTANDLFIYGNLANNLAVGSTVILSAGTVTTTGIIAAVPPSAGSFTTFLTNDSGVRCSGDGVAFGPTAAPVSVSGRVTTAAGRGIRNVQITLTDASGNTKTAQTTAFGYYRFEDAPAGETVTISVKVRRFRFEQSTIVRTTNDSISDADFVGEQ